MTDNQHNNALLMLSVIAMLCYYADCHILFTFMLNVIMLNVIILSVIMLSVVGLIFDTRHT
jgi:hypothetical protein